MKTAPIVLPISGFARSDLTAILASFTLLIMLFLGMGNTTRTASEAVGCQSNHQKIAQAWLAHAEDNSGFVIGHNESSNNARFPWGGNVWLTWEVDPNFTNTSSVLVYFRPYIGENSSIFRCPSDRFVSKKQQSAGWRQRIRSYSINTLVGVNSSGWAGGFPTYTRLQDFNVPSETFVFLEEHPGSINDSAFASDPAGARNPSQARLIDIPASFHNQAGHFGFADGHVELHRWVGPRVVQPVVAGRYLSLGFQTPDDPDAVWLGRHASHLR
jgi:prepilin-type processing-associated H-X9-DG protein